MRTLIDHSIGPVWEANHVWLIYVLVMWWTGFPESFAATMTTLAVPLMLALLGIVLRGASFAFRKYAATLGQARLFGVVFAGSSLITPFFLGAAVGAIASGRVPADGNGDLFGSWLTPTSLLGGVDRRRHLRLPGRHVPRGRCAAGREAPPWPSSCAGGRSASASSPVRSCWGRCGRCAPMRAPSTTGCRAGPHR